MCEMRRGSLDTPAMDTSGWVIGPVVSWEVCERTSRDFCMRIAFEGCISGTTEHSTCGSLTGGVSVCDSSGSHSRARGWHNMHQGSRSDGRSGAGSPLVSARCAAFMSATASWIHAWQTMWCRVRPLLSVPHANGIPSYKSRVCVRGWKHRQHVGAVDVTHALRHSW